MARTATVENYMTRNPVTFTPGTDIHHAIGTLLKNRISGAPVLDEHGELVGVISKKDCLRIAFSTSYHQEPGGRVSDFMSREVETVGAETDIVEVAEFFLNSRYRRFPVVRDGRLIGVISRHDVLGALQDLW